MMHSLFYYLIDSAYLTTWAKFGFYQTINFEMCNKWSNIT